MSWIYYNANPAGKHTGDCVVRALSYAMGQSWDKTYLELAERGFLQKEMPSWNPTWWAYLKNKGWRRYLIPDDCPDCKYTVDDFCMDHPNGIYVLFIPQSKEEVGHVVAIDHGDLIDTWNSLDELPLVYWRKE